MWLMLMSHFSQSSDDDFTKTFIHFMLGRENKIHLKPEFQSFLGTTAIVSVITSVITSVTTSVITSVMTLRRYDQNQK